ncbi:MAG: sensor histidine kinase [Rubrivivax sp.]|jgi:signal transduction histidine kinase
MSDRPLSEGNWLQRRYHRWALPHYEKLSPELRLEVERADRWLFSRQGLWAWAALLSCLCASVAALVVWTRMSTVEAVLLALICWISILLLVGGAWLLPEKYAWSGIPSWSKVARALLAGVLGMLAGVIVSGAVSGDLEKLLDGPRLLSIFGRGLPWVLAAMAVMGLISVTVAWISRWRMQVQVRSLRLAAERDAAAREAAEARLKLLQAQIHPHFIFNTLSAVQHWVDQGDPRGGPLLKTLTAFLRGSTDMMDCDRVPLDRELQMATHYLDVMQARLGARLRHRIEAAAAFGAHELPPGLVLTLVENAVEHAIEPSLQGGTIEVRVHAHNGSLCIDVQDDGPGRAAEWVEGVGLRNTRARLAHAFGTEAALELGPAPTPDRQGTLTRIRLPLN